MERDNKVCILHLSDLHFSKKIPSNMDCKEPVQASLSSEEIDLFESCLKRISEKPDYVVVSGDITTNGEEEGFTLFNSVIEKMINQKKLPPFNNFIVVPGNHDVTKGSSIGEKSRWRNFKEFMGKDCLIPWIAGVDPGYDDMEALVDEAFASSASVLGRIVKDPKTSKIYNLPFLLDRDKKVIFYAFNSSLLSQITLDDEIEKKIIFDIKTRYSQELKMMELAGHLEKRLEIDPSRIVMDEIRLFACCTNKMKELLAEEYDDFLKIAVLHHHIAPIACNEEIKSFEMMMNVGYFKRVLVRQGFQVVFHGHKHWNEVYRDTAISGGGELLVISGGTIFGWSDREKRAGFYFLPFSTEEKTVTPLYYEMDNSFARKPCEERKVSYIPVVCGEAFPDKEDKGREVNLKKLFSRVEEALLQNILQDEEEGGRLKGWGKVYTTDGEKGIGTMATAYGLIIAELLHINTDSYLQQKPQITETLWEFRFGEGGFKAQSQGQQPAIEATVCALRAFAYAGDMEKKKAVLGDLEELLLQKPLDEKSSVTTLTLVMDVLCEFCPESERIGQIREIILKKAQYGETGNPLYWPVSGEIEQKNSVIWTALAVISLLNEARRRGRLEEERERLKDCGKWLLGKEWQNCREDIRRRICRGTRDKLNYRHFTAPWCVVAMLRLGYETSEPRLAEEMRRILKIGEKGCWPWEDEPDYPIWTIYDALTAILEFALSGMKL